MHRAGAAHAAHDLIQDQQRAVAVANLPHALEIARDRGDAAGRRANHGFGQKGDDRFGAETLELRLQFRAKPFQIRRVGFAVMLEPVSETRRHQAVRLAQDRLVIFPPHHVPARRQRAKRGAMIRLPSRDRADSSRLPDLQEILPRELDRRFVALGPRGTEPRAGQPARFVMQQDLRQIFGRLVGERSGVSIGHGRGLTRDRLGHAAVAVAEGSDRRATGGIDDRAAVAVWSQIPSPLIATGGMAPVRWRTRLMQASDV